MPALPAPPLANLADHLVGQARQRPDADALFVPRGTTAAGAIDYLRLSFSELERETRAWVHLLERNGIRKGTRTLVLVRPGLPLIAVAFALFRIGAIPVLLDPGIGLKAFLACVKRTRPEALVGIPVARLLSRLFLPTFRSLRHRIAVPGSLVARLPANAPLADTLHTPDPEEVAALLFTSGSTGAPKGVVYRQRHFAAQIQSVKNTYAIRPGEVDMTLLPIFALFNPALGMATVVPELNPRRPADLNPARLVQAITERGVTNAFGAPPLWKRIAAWCEREDRNLHGMRRILLAGAPVPPDLLLRLRKLMPSGEVHTPYGATECLPIASASGSEILALSSPATPGNGVCVGLPVAGVRIALVRPYDSTHSEPVPVLPGEPGEVLCSGPVVTDAYDALPEATAAAKVLWAGPDGGTERLWHRMGDIGRTDAEGRLWFLGRKVERVPTSGGMLHSEEIEPVFNRHPRVERSALIGIGLPGSLRAAVVIEPQPDAFPRSDRERTRFAMELAALGQVSTPASLVEYCYFLKHLPVDVRHNAKIHRLTLSRLASQGKLGPRVALAAHA